MIIEALEGFTRHFKWAGRFIYKAIRQGLDIHQTYRVIEEHYPYYYPWSLFSHDYRFTKGLYNKWYRARFVRKDRTLSERFYHETKIWLRRKYFTTFEMQIYNTRTGQRDIIRTSIYHDTIMKREELEREAIEQITEGLPTDIEVEWIRPVIMLKRAWG